MATAINPHRFDRRCSRLAAELAGTLTPDERRALALVLRHKVSGRWSRSSGATAIAVLAASRGRSRVVEVGADVAGTLSGLVRSGWVRFVPLLEGRGCFWCSHAGEDVVRAAGLSALDLDPDVPA